MRLHNYRLVAFGLALAVPACGDESSQSEVAQTTPTVADTASAVVTSLEPAPEFAYGTADVASDEQPAGFYKVPDWSSLAFTFGTTEAYRGIGEPLTDSSIFGIAQGTKALPQRQLLFWASTPGFTAKDFLVELRETADLEFGDESAATVAGNDATVVDAAASELASIQALGTLVDVPASWDTNSSEVRLRFMVLEIGDRTLVIYIEAPTAEFDDFIVTADKVLATVQFRGT